MTADCCEAFVAVPLLQRAHVDFIALQRGDAFCGGPGRSHGGDGGNAACDGGAANGFFVEPWLSAVRSVDDELDAIALDQIHHVRPAFFYFVNAIHRQPGTLQAVGGAVGGDKAESHFHKTLRQLNGLLLVAVNHADKDRALRGQRLSGGKLGLGEGLAESVG